MIIKNKYRINYKDIDDIFFIVVPQTDIEKKEFYKFRYEIYLREGYIDNTQDNVDIDQYDYDEKKVFYVGIRSKKQNRLIGSVRIITSNPLPITKDCFNFKTPLAIKLFSKGKLLEVSRLVIDKYGEDNFLPRNLIMTLLIKEVLAYSRDNNIYFGYAFIKKSLMSKLKKIYFPFYKINNYEQKYKEGVLIKYFNQVGNPVIPVYFNYYIIKAYLFLAFLKFNKYLCR